MILVDFDMLAHRCFNAMDDVLSVDGKSTGMEFGVMRGLKSLGKRISRQPHKIVLCLEGGVGKKSSKPSWYKANRKPAPPSFYERKEILLNNLKQVYHWAIASGHEADQVMYTLSMLKGWHFIYTNDSDLYQAIDETTIVVRSFESQLFYWDKDKLFEKFKVWPYMYAIYKTIVGDPTDNIPGIKRIRKRLAAEMARNISNHYIGKLNLSPMIAIRKCLLEYKHRMSSAMQEKFDEFIDTNQFSINYELIKLKLDVMVSFMEPLGDSIQPYLDSLKIKSLSYEDETEF
jgi:5'-3' exonuclease